MSEVPNPACLKPEYGLRNKFLYFLLAVPGYFIVGQTNQGQVYLVKPHLLSTAGINNAVDSALQRGKLGCKLVLSLRSPTSHRSPCPSAYHPRAHLAMPFAM